MSDKPTYVVRFRGGPLGGETQTYHKFPGAKLEVPALNHVSLLGELSGGTVEPQIMRTETYYLFRTGLNEFEYRWRNPNETLLRENRALQARIRELEAVQPVLEAIKSLKGIL